MNLINRVILGLALSLSLLQMATFAEGEKKSPEGKASDRLPTVLIVGDSISIGYTEAVRNLLKGKAKVSRPPTNCGTSGKGVGYIKKWMGDTKWDVIHFNFGIWDTHLLHNGSLVRDLSKFKKEELKRRYTTEQHVENLSKIVAAMKPTGAKLIWASTTPYVSYGEDTKLLIVANNQAAKTLMDKEGVFVNDLYGLALPKLKEWQSKDGCHFTKTGYNELAKQVATAISEVLKKNAKPVKP